MNNKITTVLLVFISFFSCADANESDLIDIVCEDRFTYTDYVKAIIDSNCVSCHNSSPNANGPFSLETYQEVKENTQNGNLLIRINLADGANEIMPPTGKMSQANIDVITFWANEGYAE